VLPLSCTNAATLQCQCTAPRKAAGASQGLCCTASTAAQSCTGGRLVQKKWKKCMALTLCCCRPVWYQVFSKTTTAGSSRRQWTGPPVADVGPATSPYSMYWILVCASHCSICLCGQQAALHSRPHGPAVCACAVPTAPHRQLWHPTRARQCRQSTMHQQPSGATHPNTTCLVLPRTCHTPHEVGQAATHLTAHDAIMRR
jgi:hypothetical protein